MSTPQTVQDRNRELAEKLIEEGLNNPHSTYMGKFVGIANGQIVVVTDSWDELVPRLREVEPDARKTFALEVGRDYKEVQEIWGLC